MWWMALLFTAIASQALADSYTAEFLNPDPTTAVFSIFNSDPSIPNSDPSIATVKWGQPAEGSRQSALTFKGANNPQPLDPSKPQPIGNFSFTNGQTIVGTEISGITLKITAHSDSDPTFNGQTVNVGLSILNTLNTDNREASADVITLPSNDMTLSSLKNFGLTQDLRPYEDNKEAAQSGLYAYRGSILLAGFGPLLDPSAGFRTGSVSADDITPLPNTANVQNLIDANGNIFPNPNFSEVPEPSIWLLISSGLPIVIWRIRFKNFS